MSSSPADDRQQQRLQLTTSSETQIQLLRFHKLLLSVYPVATWPPDHPARLLKQCLSRLSPLLETGSSSTGTSISAGMANPVNGTSAAKKGKKRARGEEDGVLASLEGREGRRIGVEAETALEALQRESCLCSIARFWWRIQLTKISRAASSHCPASFSAFTHALYPPASLTLPRPALPLLTSFCRCNDSYPTGRGCSACTGEGVLDV